MAGIEQIGTFALSAMDAGEIQATGMIERGVKIFKVGTFIDSRGREATYTAEDLDLAAANFRELRDSNIFPNVPVRQDHTTSIRDIVAYMTDVRREGNFLVADWEWSSAAAKESWDNKHFRNRSAEIGTYVTNDGRRVSPVLTGLAFVDIPAVEGLYRIQTGEHMSKPITSTEGETEEETPPVEPAAEETPPVEPAVEETPPVEPAAEEEEPPAPAPVPETETFRNGQVESHTFRINGDDVSDFARVQSHIEELETFRTETIQTSRTSFIDQLAENRIIGGPQADSFRVLAPTMSNDQWSQFTKSWEGATPSNLFGRHDLGGDKQSGGPEGETASRIQILEQIVQSHRFRNLPEEDIVKLGSYRELQALKNA